MFQAFDDSLNNIKDLLQKKKSTQNAEQDALMLSELCGRVHADIMESHGKYAYSNVFSRYAQDGQRYIPSQIVQQIDELLKGTSQVQNEGAVIVVGQQQQLSGISITRSTSDLDFPPPPVPEHDMEGYKTALAHVDDTALYSILERVSFEHVYDKETTAKQVLVAAYFDSDSDFEYHSTASELQGLRRSRSFTFDKKHIEPALVLGVLRQDIETTVRDTFDDMATTVNRAIARYLPQDSVDIFDTLNHYSSWLNECKHKLEVYTSKRQQRSGQRDSYYDQIDHAMMLHGKSTFSISELQELESSGVFTTLDVQSHMVYQKHEKKVLRQYLLQHVDTVGGARAGNLPEDFQHTLSKLERLVRLRRDFKTFVAGINARVKELTPESYLFYLQAQEEEYTDFIGYTLSDIANPNDFAFYARLSVQDVVANVRYYKTKQVDTLRRHKKATEAEQKKQEAEKEEAHRALFDKLQGFSL